MCTKKNAMQKTILIAVSNVINGKVAGHLT
jgi:hypothetical protein